MKLLKSYEIVPAHPWDRREDETDKAYAAFQVYLNLGEERSQDATAKKLGKWIDQIHRWADKYRWWDRVVEYDTWLVTREQEAKGRVIAEQAELWQRRKMDECESCYDVATRLRAKGLEMLDSPLYAEHREKNGELVEVKPVKWNLTTCVSMLKLAAELAMVACDEAQETGDNFDAVTASPDECREYLKIVLDRRKTMKNLGGD